MSYRNVLRDSGEPRLCRADGLLINVHAPLQPPLKCHPHLRPHSRLTLYTLLPLASLFLDPTPPIPAALASRLTHTSIWFSSRANYRTFGHALGRGSRPSTGAIVGGRIQRTFTLFIFRPTP